MDLIIYFFNIVAKKGQCTEVMHWPFEDELYVEN